MNYELAKELRDAGYQQYGSNLDHCGEPVELYLSSDSYETTKCYVPTLSELIEACGEKFYDLSQREKGEWITNRDDMFHSDYPVGSTPEEAVARLWLALNKK